MDLPWAHKRVLDEQGDLQGARLCPAAIQALLNADCPPHKVTVPDDQPVTPAAWRTSIEGAARRASAAVGGVGAQQATRRGLTGSYRTVWRALRDNRGPRSGGARRGLPVPRRGEDTQFDSCNLDGTAAAWGWNHLLLCFGAQAHGRSPHRSRPVRSSSTTPSPEG